MKAWFGADLENVNRLLEGRGPRSEGGFSRSFSDLAWVYQQEGSRFDSNKVTLLSRAT